MSSLRFQGTEFQKVLLLFVDPVAKANCQHSNVHCFEIVNKDKKSEKCNFLMKVINHTYGEPPILLPPLPFAALFEKVKKRLIWRLWNCNCKKVWKWTLKKATQIKVITNIKVTEISISIFFLARISLLCFNSRGAGLPPAPRSLYKVLAGSGTRCDKSWY